MPLRFIQKRHRGSENSGAVAQDNPTPTTIDGLHSTDIIVSNTGAGVYILSGGQIAAHLMLGKIANWTITGTRITIYSLDDAPLELTFLTVVDATNGLVVIEDAINNLP